MPTRNCGRRLTDSQVAEVLPRGASKSALAALADAQALLQSRGPASAVDRVHTGIHGYLESVCRAAGIDVAEDASANALLKALLAGHPALTDLGPRTEEIKRMLKGSGSIIDAMGTVRNNASLAHPNEELLGHDEAVLVINLGRSLLGYLDSKLSPQERGR